VVQETEIKAILDKAKRDGIESMQQGSPDYALSPTHLAKNTESTCVSNSGDLLQKGGLYIAGRTPSALWNNAFENYGSGERKFTTPLPMAPGGRPIYEGQADPRPGTEYVVIPGDKLVLWIKTPLTTSL